MELARTHGKWLHDRFVDFVWVSCVGFTCNYQFSQLTVRQRLLSRPLSRQTNVMQALGQSVVFITHYVTYYLQNSVVELLHA